MQKDIQMNLQETFKKKIVPELQKELGIKNVMAVPKVQKVVVSAGIGMLMRNSKDFSHVEEAMAKLTGQKPLLINARKSVSNFKLREGMPNGLQVTLRGKRMWDFLERLVKMALPRVRDFRGINAKLDGRGNYSLGLAENSIFPEVEEQEINKVHGMQVTVTTSAENDEAGKLLLTKLGFPFKK